MYGAVLGGDCLCVGEDRVRSVFGLVWVVCGLGLLSVGLDLVWVGVGCGLVWFGLALDWVGFGLGWLWVGLEFGVIGVLVAVGCGRRLGCSWL